MEKASKYLILLDSDFPSAEETGFIAHWAKRSVFSSDISIVEFMEKKAERIRSEYLAWCYEIGKRSCGKQNLIDYFKLGKYPSFWWMSSIFDSGLLTTPEIFLIFKLRALELFLLENNVSHVELKTNDYELCMLIKNFCSSLGVGYSHVYTLKNRFVFIKNSFFSKIYRSFFSCFIQAFLVWLRVTLRYFVYFADRAPMSQAKEQLTVVTYFPNINKRSADQGYYKSSYWDEAGEFLEKKGVCNWVWIYANNDYYSLKESVKLKRKFLENALESKKYYFIEEFLSPSSLLKVLVLYAKLVFRDLTKKNIDRGFSLPGSKFNFWSILRGSWRSSFLGKVAMNNCLRNVEFSNLADQLPKQKLVVYAWENQVWEQALASAWKRYQKTPIYGYQHSSVVYFDLRYFKDARWLNSCSELNPDLWLVNGSGAMDLLLNSGFPKEKIRSVEATRYTYLGKQKGAELKGKNILLVLTGYSADLVRQQLGLLSQVADDIYNDYEKIIIKPHPNQPVFSFINEFKLSSCEISHESLEELLSNASKVYLDNHTTASVETLLLKKPAIIHVPNNFFNLCPFYSPEQCENDICYVSTADQLKGALMNYHSHGFIKKDYFYLSDDFFRWKRVLEIPIEGRQEKNNYETA